MDYYKIEKDNDTFVVFKRKSDNSYGAVIRYSHLKTAEQYVIDNGGSVKQANDDKPTNRSKKDHNTK